MTCPRAIFLSFAMFLIVPLHVGAEEFYHAATIYQSPVSNSPFAVGGTARKALPPMDCLRCCGPRPCPPGCGKTRGFLYYGTDPCHDDCFNSMDDCPHGCCGEHACRWSLAWIRWHKR